MSYFTLLCLMLTCRPFIITFSCLLWTEHKLSKVYFADDPCLLYRCCRTRGKARASKGSRIHWLIDYEWCTYNPAEDGFAGEGSSLMSSYKCLRAAHFESFPQCCA